ncbi:MAG: hypothetical protein A3G34_11770 [Candidatus Lindowbacteria bacterium RIFCSPLOWO2_12_FULL_62_27]|nr:MAG: hypothetical protein A3G34_11770 [Candidatus Lindowbacteria bacterium RIFCSPLOWO2_12_FULL_62_27]OGH56168.1 MAG: hypothetical protein A3I06_01810 [Candidatus Lindowbacteria bacterium RIFCSPLOWO2_02_FULL_62_12]
MPALFGDFIWDDRAYIPDNPAMNDAGGLMTIWFKTGEHQFYPLVCTSFWVEHRLWGSNPFGYHLVNVLLHAANAFILFRILVRLKLPGAFLVSLLFAVHPIHAESVAWIVERKNTLSGFFALLSLERFVIHGESGRRRDLALSTICYLLALLSKTSVIGLPILMGFIHWYRTGRLDRITVGRLVPLLSMTVILALRTVWIEHPGADLVVQDSTLAEKGPTAAAAVWFYVLKIIIPLNLSFVYPPIQASTEAAADWAKLAAVLLLLVLAVGLCRRFGKGTLVIAVATLLLLGPMLGFVKISYFRFSNVANRWAYLASIPVLTALVWGVRDMAGRLRLPARAGGWTGAAVVIGFAIVTHLESRSYRTPDTLWAATIKNNPHAGLAYNQLGKSLYQRGEVQAAVRRFEQSIRMEPGSYSAASAYSELARIASDGNDVRRAIGCYEQALAILPQDADNHYNIAVLAAQTGQIDVVLHHLESASRLRPRNAQVHFFLGSVLEKKGFTQRAIEHYQVAAALSPQNAAVHEALGRALTRPASGTRAQPALGASETLTR